MSDATRPASPALAEFALLESWLPVVDAFRTFAIGPLPELRAVFQQIQALTVA
jgi:hypothetical protein